MSKKDFLINIIERKCSALGISLPLNLSSKSEEMLYEYLGKLGLIKEIKRMCCLLGENVPEDIWEWSISALAGYLKKLELLELELLESRLDPSI